jgi:predicted kinase
MKHVPEMIILVGIPGAGKTDFAVNKVDTHLVLSGTVLNTNPKFDSTFAAVLATQTSFIIDKTNGKKESRKELIRKAKGFGYRCVGYFFNVTADEVLSANSDRVETEKNFEVMVKGASKQMETPQFDEGFDDLFTVVP